MTGFLAITAKELLEWVLIGVAVGAGFEVGREIAKRGLQDEDTKHNLSKFLTAGAPIVLDDKELRELRKLFNTMPKAQ